MSTQKLDGSANSVFAVKPSEYNKMVESYRFLSATSIGKYIREIEMLIPHILNSRTITPFEKIRRIARITRKLNYLVYKPHKTKLQEIMEESKKEAYTQTLGSQSSTKSNNDQTDGAVEDINFVLGKLLDQVLDESQRGASPGAEEMGTPVTPASASRAGPSSAETDAPKKPKTQTKYSEGIEKIDAIIDQFKKSDRKRTRSAAFAIARTKDIRLRADDLMIYIGGKSTGETLPQILNELNSSDPKLDKISEGAESLLVHLAKHPQFFGAEKIKNPKIKKFYTTLAYYHMKRAPIGIGAVMSPVPPSRSKKRKHSSTDL